MQNLIAKLGQSSIISEKLGLFSEKLKLWRAPAIIEFNIFCWNFVHVLYLAISSEECAGFFLFCLNLELLIEM